MEILGIAIILVIVGGALNGTFAIPGRYVKSCTEDKMWFYLAFWAYLIVPFVTLYILYPPFIHALFQVNSSYILAAFFGGVVWGVGMIFCLLGFRYVGLSVTYAINIGMGTAGGSILPLILLHREKLHTTFGYVIILGVCIFVVGVIFASLAANVRDRGKIAIGSINHAKIGIICAVIAGIGSMTQGYVFAYATGGFLNTPYLQGASVLVRSNLPWVWIFLGAFFPNVIYFGLASRKKQNNFTVKTDIKGHIISQILIAIMAILFFECLILYGLAAGLIGSVGPIIAYPIFMVFIVLTSNFWGFKFGEWHGASKKARFLIGVAILALVLAVLLQGISARFQ